MTGKPKEFRGRHKRESMRMQMGVAAIIARAEKDEHLTNPAANARVSDAVGACWRIPLHAQGFNPAACAAIIR